MTVAARAVVYLRVSTDEQAESGLGMEAQLAACRAWCERNGTVPGGVHLDEGVSGSTAPTSRLGLTDALAELAEGDVLLVAKRDRLTRDTFYACILERTVGAMGARIVSAAGEGTDDDSPTSILMRRILDAFAEYERLLIGARTKAALRAKAIRGERLGRPPYGWRVADGVWAEVPEEQTAIREAALCRAGGMTLQATADRLTGLGYPPPGSSKSWGTSNVDRVSKMAP